MATKRFDDATEQARALEAKAKKLRREAQAARTKASFKGCWPANGTRRDLQKGF